jgi:hypothetical protein
MNVICDVRAQLAKTLIVVAGLVGCSSRPHTSADAGPGTDATSETAPPGDGASDGASDVGSDSNGDAASQAFITARFGNFDTTLPAWDICVRTLLRNGTTIVTPDPLLAAIPGLADGVLLDRVTRWISIPWLPSTTESVSEMFLVRADTTDCSAPTERLLTGHVFGFFARTAGERNSFVALDPWLVNLVKGRPSCPSSKACVNFNNFLTLAGAADGGAAGPNIDLYIIDGGGRTRVYSRVPAGDCGPLEMPYVVEPFAFDRTTCTVEIPAPAAGSLTLAVGESGATDPFVQVELTDPAAQLFSLWIVGHRDGTGPAAKRAILCRDFAPETDAFSQCSRVAP